MATDDYGDPERMKRVLGGLPTRRRPDGHVVPEEEAPADLRLPPDLDPETVFDEANSSLPEGMTLKQAWNFVVGRPCPDD